MDDIAVAVEYCTKANIPKIVAKGKGLLAKRILDKAKEYNIPIYKDKDLAVTLVSLEIGSYIPEQLYMAVATVLAYCYSVNAQFKEKLNNVKI